ncbi:MAG: hypothetical protein A3F35_02300 [Candidatus Woykebacteria bacterium RIFCSPHIGHO2_12_FULL_45_10]|uniref:DUF3048 domain-containing protein n=1 Tax=Candidatus Woykebacteria bacterium RIFCSPHIGHO2_12_FULL_45_10 TaxID=1802603 RepID=A0A1G1WNM3_9BACT|nr:MAG: hypothetical protein A3F35_02300 [Candidatus Woykebacteria bacterium RIFCSPHIGHO2_12_FULL_45_10]
MTYWLRGFRHLPRVKKFLVVLVLGVFCSLAGLGGFLFGEAKAERQLQRVLSPLGTLISGKPAEARDFPDPLNGVLYTKTQAAGWKDKLPLAVIVENHTDARPQSGMSKAEITYEALAEGGITRTMNLFLAEDTDVGPVRSNRTYFLDWLSEYGAGYAHVGGSPEAQSLVKTYGIADLDQFGLGTTAYDRVSFRFAPHNVYTSTARLRDAASKKGYNGPVAVELWKFKNKEASPSSRPASFNLKIGFGAAYSLSDYDVEWRYDPKTNTYLRFNGGASHTDETTKQQLTAKTIIVESLVTSLDPSGHSRLKMQTIGSGDVKIFTDGAVFSGTWKKDSRTSRTRFYDNAGGEIALNRGKIWVEIVPVGSTITY